MTTLSKINIFFNHSSLYFQWKLLIPYFKSPVILFYFLCFQSTFRCPWFSFWNLPFIPNTIWQWFWLKQLNSLIRYFPLSAFQLLYCLFIFLIRQSIFLERYLWNLFELPEVNLQGFYFYKIFFLYFTIAFIFRTFFTEDLFLETQYLHKVSCFITNSVLVLVQVLLSFHFFFTSQSQTSLAFVF